MATVDINPDPAAWRIVQKVIANINPKVSQVELNQVLNPAFVNSLTESGYLSEAKKGIR